MKPEFIPTQFTEESGECKICDARKEWERLLSEESDLLFAYGVTLYTSSPSSSLVEAYLRLLQSLGDALADYRTCFAQNLALYFTVQVPGRLRKEPGFLGACDEYRDRALASLQGFEQAFETFQQVSDPEQIERIATTHSAAIEAARSFWSEIDVWTKERYKTASNVFGTKQGA
jgi:hypothetical protein